MKIVKALESGFVGACTLTLIHEVIRRKVPEAPRMDLLGMNALSKVLRKFSAKIPDKDQLFGWTLVGDIVGNTLYYSLAGAGSKKTSIAKGTMLGLTAGLGAVMLPKKMGLNDAPSNRTLQTKVMTVAWYVIGGIVSAAVYKMLENKK
jgi:hypothetical protein